MAKTPNGSKSSTPPGWKVGTDGSTMEFRKVPVYIRDVAFRKEKGKDNKQVRVCVVQVFMQPFTLAMARILGVAGELFNGEQRNNHIKMSVLDLNVGRLPFGIEFFVAPDMEDPTIEIDTANIGPTINVRTDKEGPIFAANLDLRFSYPDPGDLLTLVNSIGDQWWVSFRPLQTELADVSEQPSAPAAAAEAQG